MMHSQNSKAIVYIDALNLYYWLLKGTPYKWLDVFTFVQKELDKKSILISEIKFFYARVSWNEKDPEAPIRQQNYIKALEKHISKFCKFTHIEWYFKSNVKKRWLLAWQQDNKIVTILTNEEKWTDVNLWVHMVYDSLTNEDFNVVCLVSNDTDLWEALRLVKLSGKVIYLIPPIKKFSKTAQKEIEWSGSNIPRMAWKLSIYAHFHSYPIAESKLANTQLPDPCEWIAKTSSW